MTNKKSSGSTDIRPFRVEIRRRTSTTSRSASRAPGFRSRARRRLGLRHAQPLPARDRRLLEERVRLARVEERINAFPQYLTEIDGQTVHFLHVPSAEKTPRRCSSAHLPGVGHRLPRR
jgi:hypothetical protein